MTKVHGTTDSQRLRQALTGLACVILSGTLGFSWIEGWSLWQSFYFTLITITTVGYQDHGVSPPGQLLVALMLLGGVGGASYTFALLVQSLVKTDQKWRRRMQAKIDQLERHTIVCGCGRMGMTICAELKSAGHEFVVIESNSEAAASAREAGFLTIEGTASDDDVLLAAGIQRATNLVAAVNSESENIVITLTAREFKNDLHIIARSESENKCRRMRRAGANRIISPFHSGGLQIANAILRPKVHELLDNSLFGESDVTFAEILIEEGSPLIGRSVADFGRSDGSCISFVALERAGSAVEIAPGGSEIFRANDHWIVAGSHAAIDSMSSEASI